MALGEVGALALVAHHVEQVFVLVDLQVLPAAVEQRALARCFMRQYSGRAERARRIASSGSSEMPSSG